MLIYSVILTIILLKDIDHFYIKSSNQAVVKSRREKDSYMYQVVIDKLKSHLFGQICHQHFIIKYLKWKKRRKPTQHEEYLSMRIFYVFLSLVVGSNPYLYGNEKKLVSYLFYSCGTKMCILHFRVVKESKHKKWRFVKTNFK